jgi:ribonuclease HI
MRCRIYYSLLASSIFKINCDVALDKNNGRMGIGSLVIRDSNGKVYAAASYVVNFLTNPVIGESMAPLKTVEFCKNMGLVRIMEEGDSFQVVNAINKPGLNWGKYGHIVANIHEGFSVFSNVEVVSYAKESEPSGAYACKRGDQFCLVPCLV